MHMLVYKVKRNELENVIDALNSRLTGIQWAIGLRRTILQGRAPAVSIDEAQRTVQTLRRYVAAWQAAHDTWDLKNPRLFRQFKRAVERTRVVLRDRAFMRRHTPWKKFTQQNTPWKKFTRPFAGLMMCAATPEDYAADLFLTFQHLIFDLGVNSIRQCARCGTYFVNRFGHHGRRFCSRACAVAQTVRHGRATAYAEKLGRVAELVATVKPGNNWKTWVDEQTGGRGDADRISRNWLTHAVHKGLLSDTGRLTPEGWALTRRQAAG
jgi:hypothetical protein